jgi:hypothetical protein
MRVKTFFPAHAAIDASEFKRPGQFMEDLVCEIKNGGAGAECWIPVRLTGVTRFNAFLAVVSG